MLYKLTIQYDGTDFHGWQVQGEGRTVQGELTQVLMKLEGRAVVVHGSGRTDAGVHAEGQVASVRLNRGMTPEKLRAAINGNLPRDVRVMEAELAPEGFHARYSARGKTYVYRIINERVVSPFWWRYALHESRHLDILKMKDAARLFLGEHDWTAFSSIQSKAKSRRRTISQLEINEFYDERARSRMTEIVVTADGFLRYMVRSIAGTLMAVGRGESDAAAVEEAINNGDRSLAGDTAPAHGLTLKRVYYDS